MSTAPSGVNGRCSSVRSAPCTMLERSVTPAASHSEVRSADRVAANVGYTCWAIPEFSVTNASASAPAPMLSEYSRHCEESHVRRWDGVRAPILADSRFIVLILMMFTMKGEHFTTGSIHLL